MKHFLVVTNKDKDPGLKNSKHIRAYLEAAGADVTIVPDIYKTGIDQSKLPKNIECAIALGGDGTILQLSRALRGLYIPMIGVNLGHLGFLAEIEVSQIDHMLDCLIQDCYHIEKRMMIRGQVMHEGKVVEESLALNDIVIARSGFSRVISYDLYVNGQLIENYQADGIIISTPTGSTAYSLSAGGPIINPIAQLIEITPVCAHARLSRSIILAKDDKISVEIKRLRKSQLEEAYATFDGQEGIRLSSTDFVNVEAADDVARLIRLDDTGFYNILKHKIS